MSDFLTDYVCLDCGCEFESYKVFRPIRCPKCNSTDTITAEQLEKNERENRREEDAEQWTLDNRRLREQRR